jgi:serine/threonine protein kinase/Tol biopolymer transport system component
MTLAAGSKLGPYEILGQIGAGGMGEVYRARDPRLGREVAVKVLPATFSADGDRLRRFEQEARAAGVLNHPNITAVYDIGSHDGAPYVVQELLEGETLRAALAGGRLAQRRTLDYATQVALGLAAAHDKGIVHRDLKPENLFVTRDGRVKILDFGLAKLTQNESEVSSATNLPTETRGTEPGVVLGTLGYMSPEQVRGKPADARSDIFSFGAILYEMLSGKRAFHGDSAADTMSAILREDPPDLSVTNQQISPALERIVRHSIEKNPEQRFQSARDLAFNLEAVSGTSMQSTVAPLVRGKPRLRPAALLLLGLAVGAGAALLATRTARREAPEEGPTFKRITNISGSEEFPTLSPDGQIVAFQNRVHGQIGIWVQRAGSRRPINLTADCKRESSAPAFSPDGSLIAYRSLCGEGGIFVMGATGESARRLTSFGSNPAWSPDGKEIVFATEQVTRPYGRTSTSELWAVEVGTGKTRKVLAEDSVQPDVSPHGLRIAYWGLPTGGSQRDIWTVPYAGLAGGERPVPVTQDAAIDWDPVWAPDGRSLYFLSNRDGTMNLWRVPIDEKTGKTLGEARSERLPAREVGGLAVAADGRHIAYVDRQTSYAIERLTFDGAGHLIGPPEVIYESSQEMSDFDLSPDGKLIAFDSRGGSQDDLFMLGSDGTGLRQILDDEHKDRAPAFSPDGKRLAFHSDRTGRYEIWTIATDGSGLTQLTKSTGDTVIEPHWAPDGKRMTITGPDNAYILPLEGAVAAGKMELIPRPTPESYFFPLAWAPDSKRVFGSLVTLAGRTTSGLILYDPNTSKFESAFPGFGTEGWARRGAAVGTRFLYRDNDGLHIADPATGTVTPAFSQGSSSAGSVGCRGLVCYAARVTENADIWMRTAAEAAASKK